MVPGGDAALPGVARLVGARGRLARGAGARAARDRPRQGRLPVALAALRAAAGRRLLRRRGDRGARSAFSVALFDRLDGSAGAFDSSQSTQPGFETLVRSLPIEGDPPRPHLPGGPALWLTAIEEELPPGDAGAAAGRPRGARAPTASTSGDPAARAGRPGRSARARSQRPAPTAPRRQFLPAAPGDLLARERRAGDARERHVRSRAERLDTMDLRSPEVARDYLLAVAQLDVSARLAAGTARDRVPGRRRVAALDGRGRPRRRRACSSASSRRGARSIPVTTRGGGGCGRAGVDRPPPARAAAGAGGRAGPRPARARHAPGAGRFRPSRGCSGWASTTTRIALDVSPRAWSRRSSSSRCRRPIDWRA